MTFRLMTDEEYLLFTATDHMELVMGYNAVLFDIRNFSILYADNGFDYPFGKAFVFFERHDTSIDDEYTPAAGTYSICRWFIVTHGDICWVRDFHMQKLKAGIMMTPKFTPDRQFIYEWVEG